MNLEINKIGYVIVNDFGKLKVRVDKEYKKAMLNLNNFSHIIIYYLCDYVINSIVCKIENITDDIIFCNHNNKISVNNYFLIDIKPYFPCEDRLDIVCKKHDYYPVSITENKVNIIGYVNNKNNQIFLELIEDIKIKDEYLKVYWWFDQFDDKKYRNILTTTPPYEKAIKSGIFATRSPVRPNPLAQTICKVKKVEKNRIYVNGIEAFNNTPILGLIGYDTDFDCFDDVEVSEYLSHWPKYVMLADYNENLENISITNSSLVKMLEINENVLVKKEKVFEEKKKGIFVKGARENNLKGIDVLIPYQQITAVVGVSGSGKSSLVNDTIYRECKRKMEYLNYSRNILAKPNVDYITGSLPAILIEQNPIRGNIYSTVGTYSCVYDYLRIIFSEVGIRHCPSCGSEIIPLSIKDILTIVITLVKNNVDKKITYINKEEIVALTLEEKVYKALEKDKALLMIDGKEEIVLQTSQKCYHCDKLMFELTPTTFSYIANESRCPECEGTGLISEIDLAKIIAYPEKSLLEGAIPFYGKLKVFIDNPNANWMKGQVIALASKYNIDLNLSWSNLPKEFKDKVLYGSDEICEYIFYNKSNGRKGEIRRPVEGLVNILNRIELTQTEIDKYYSKKPCHACLGERLNKEGRMVTIFSYRYPDVAKMTFKEIGDFCNELEKLPTNKYQRIENSIASIKDIVLAATILGIDYLPLSQTTNTLSAGEAQRLKTLGAYLNHLSHILYVFDEPSKGLDPRDYIRIEEMFKKLKDDNNTILMVEHNLDMIKLADNIIEIGPKAGINGGYLIASGSLEEILKSDSELTKYYNQEVVYTHRLLDKYVEMNNLNSNNLKNISIKFPFNAITTIYGVSGSGKTTLLKKEIYKKFKNDTLFADCILVDSEPIGKNIKSTVSTYIGIMDNLRQIFATTKDAIERNMNERYFSYNQEGACEKCNGDGQIEVKYVLDTYEVCPDCHGTRYIDKVLDVYYQGKNIVQVLNMEINEAVLFFNDILILKALKMLDKVGLGYLKLGQATKTLSGGEATRLKLAKELLKSKRNNTLFLLDEPTTGLHFSDIENLIKMLNELSLNNTIVAIEHNKEFIKASDYLIELGPSAGIKGGEVLHQSINKTNKQKK